jgi:hypothetical protein
MAHGRGSVAKLETLLAGGGAGGGGGGPIVAVPSIAGSWVKLCDEGGTAVVDAHSDVRFGALDPNPFSEGGGAWLHRTCEARCTIAATNEQFGGDPAPNVRKVLQLWESPAAVDRALLFVSEEVLGRGSNSAIHLAWYYGAEVALKRVSRDAIGGAPAMLRSEAQLMRRMEHPNVLPLLHMFGSADDPDLQLVVPLSTGGSVRGVLASLRAPPPAPWAKRVLVETATALAYMHKLGFVHADVKSDNLLVKGDGGVWLSDFNMTRRVDAPKPGTPRFSEDENVLGTQEYLAPENLVLSPPSRLNSAYFGSPAGDVFALGVLAVELATGVAPWAGRALGPIAEDLRSGRMPQVPAGVDAELAELARQCLSAEPPARPSASDVAARLRNMGWGGATAAAAAAPPCPAAMSEQLKRIRLRGRDRRYHEIPREWVCGAAAAVGAKPCQHRNPLRATAQCEKCRAGRVEFVDGPPWGCQRCSFDNEVWRTACFMCASKKGALAYWKCTLCPSSASMEGSVGACRACGGERGAWRCHCARVNPKATDTCSGCSLRKNAPPPPPWDCQVCSKEGNRGPACAACSSPQGAVQPWDCLICTTRDNLEATCKVCGKPRGSHPPQPPDVHTAHEPPTPAVRAPPGRFVGRLLAGLDDEWADAPAKPYLWVDGIPPMLSGAQLLSELQRHTGRPVARFFMRLVPNSAQNEGFAVLSFAAPADAAAARMFLHGEKLWPCGFLDAAPPDGTSPLRLLIDALGARPDPAAKTRALASLARVLIATRVPLSADFEPHKISEQLAIALNGSLAPAGSPSIARAAAFAFAALLAKVELERGPANPSGGVPISHFVPLKHALTKFGNSDPGFSFATAFALRTAGYMGWGHSLKAAEDGLRSALLLYGGDPLVCEVAADTLEKYAWTRSDNQTLLSADNRLLPRLCELLRANAQQGGDALAAGALCGALYALLKQPCPGRDEALAQGAFSQAMRVLDVHGGSERACKAALYLMSVLGRRASQEDRRIALEAVLSFQPHFALGRAQSLATSALLF